MKSLRLMAGALLLGVITLIAVTLGRPYPAPLVIQNESPIEQREVIEDLTKYIVFVVSSDRWGHGIRGSGVIVNAEEGLVYTARHMIEDPYVRHEVTYRTKFGAVTTTARVRIQGDLDWAVLVTDEHIQELKHGIDLYPLGPDPAPYSEVLAIGHALGFNTVTVTEGRLQEIGGGFVRFSAPIIFGNSGGALIVLANGKPVLLGIVFAGYAAPNGQFVTHLALAVDTRVMQRY